MEKEKDIKNTLAVISIAFLTFVGILTETSLNVIFPTLMREFHVSLDVIQWTTTGYLLVIAIIMISSSYLNLRFSARNLFIFATIAFIVGSLISGLATNFPVLLAGRIISALGTGVCAPMMFNLIVEIMPQAKWGFYMGTAALVLAMAPTFGPAFGGAVNFYFNWRLVFFLVVVFAILVFICGIFVIGKYHEIKRPKFDWLGYLEITLAFISFTIGINQISKGLGNRKLWGLLLASAFFVYLFVRRSQKSSKKLLNLAVLKNKPFVFGALAYFLLQLVNIGTSFVLPNYVQIIEHQTSLVGGLILLPGSIIAGLLNPFFGKLYDRRGAKLPLYLGGSLFTVATLLFCIFGLDLTSIMIMWIYGLLMLGHRMSFSNTMTEALKVQDNTLRTDATAVLQTSQQFAGSVGTTILAAIIAVFQKQGGSSYASLTAKGSQVAFGITLILAIVILICDWMMFMLEKKSK